MNPSLTPAMTVALEHLLQGRTDAEVANDMGLSESAVQTMVAEICSLVGLCDRSELLNLLREEVRADTDQEWR